MSGNMKIMGWMLVILNVAVSLVGAFDVFSIFNVAMAATLVYLLTHKRKV